MLTHPEVHTSPDEMTVPQSLLGDSQATLRQVEGLLCDFSLATSGETRGVRGPDVRALETVLSEGYDEVIRVARLVRRGRTLLTDLETSNGPGCHGLEGVQQALANAEERLGHVVELLARLGHLVDEGSEPPH